ncbi:MAG: S-methyl-5-thioribose-1-phosphate isomerase [Clostridiaceae bacterium]|nr:S-methyl-5-thioribose-1-phosphate isomerase [Clostridiaceae bacterium]
MRPLYYEDGVLKLIDQTKLPANTVWHELKSYEQVAKAIKDMIVRGAPAIGVSAAYGIVIGVNGIVTDDKDVFFKELNNIADVMKNTRPTAVNLFWAVDRIVEKAYQNKDKSIDEIKKEVLREAQIMDQEDVENNRKIGEFGNSLIKPKDTILTHCNAGSLATCGYGTALSVIRAAHEAGKEINVFANETRPYLQGARLTAYELMQDGIPVTLICDNMAGYFMHKGEINCCIVGADRIASNGDTANKIGTYTIAVLAMENNIPFYVAAPVSTIDFGIATGDEIIIEERNHKEVTHIREIQLAPEGVNVKNPAFDVTPNHYITAIITEMGILYPPFSESIKSLKESL